MRFWKYRFWKQPRKTFLRRALFQVHLWTGVAIGLYIILISVTGSAVVFRRDLLQTKLGNVPAKDAPAGAVRLSDPQLRDAVLRQYPGYTITKMSASRRRLAASEVRLSGALLCLMCLSGVLIWWRASGAWYKGFFFNPKHGWKRINFDLHSALGFWSLAILFMWGVTGIYFAYPDPFIAVVDYFEPPDQFPSGRRGDAFLAWIVKMHFGRYGGMGVRITYVIIGLLPAVMFVSGSIMWWNRVLRRWWVAERKTTRQAAAFPGQATAGQVD